MDSATARISEWRLSAADIQSDLESGTPIVRSRNNDATALTPTAATDGFSLGSIVKGKLASDQQLASADITAEADGSEIKLRGSAGSADMVGRAIAIALETPGVTRVTSSLKVSSTAP